LVFSFSKESDLLSSLSGIESVCGLKVTLPKFWEYEKFLDFLASEYRVQLPYNVKRYLMDAVENDSQSWSRALGLLALHFDSGKDMQLDHVKKIISTSRIDKFALASLIGQRKRKDFYKSLMGIDFDFDLLRGLFSFVASHLFKMIDADKLQKKSKINKYEKELISHSTLWTKEELAREVKLFGSLEIESKKKNPNLRDLIRQEYLKEIA